ncbi:MAG: cupin domain-containing protein [Spirochaetota bacterium]|nr:MAG: cupin domain-containing protein [Spirochaetota bacterium]
MKRKKVSLPREIYKFPEGEITHVNWREIEPDPPGKWPGIYGDVETELIICRENNKSEQTVMGRSVYHSGAYHEPHCHFYSEEFIFCLSGKCVVGSIDKEYLFTPGDTQFAKIGVIHWLRNPFDEPVEFLWIYSGAAMPFESGYATPDVFAEGMSIYKKNKMPK